MNAQDLRNTHKVERGVRVSESEEEDVEQEIDEEVTNEEEEVRDEEREDQRSDNHIKSADELVTSPGGRTANSSRDQVCQDHAGCIPQWEESPVYLLSECAGLK